MSKEHKKGFFDSIVTMYGRQSVIEILQDSSIEIYALHLSRSNKDEGAIKKIKKLASMRGVTIKYHEKKALSYISKNGRQDQGVAIDIEAKNYKTIDALQEDRVDMKRVVALEGIQNPQNLGMIIRSCAAGEVDALLLSKTKSAKLSPLVMKASAGTLFKMPIYHCDNLADAIALLSEFDIYTLSSYAKQDIYDIDLSSKNLFIFGNESEGVSEEVASLSTKSLKIPMNRGVESLNVAVAASLVAFLR